MKSSLIVTFEVGTDSMISMRPAPALLLPFQLYEAPLPEAGVLTVRCIAGSSFSQGDQLDQRLKSSIIGKTSAAGAWMVVLRSMRKLSGLVAANASTPMITTPRPTATFLS